MWMKFYNKIFITLYRIIGYHDTNRNIYYFVFEEHLNASPKLLLTESMINQILYNKQYNPHKFKRYFGLVRKSKKAG